MVLAMSLATLIFDKVMAVLFIQLLGILLMLAVAFVCMKLVDHIIPLENQRHQAVIRVLAFFSALAYYPLVYWSLMGMETGLITLFLLSGILAAFNYEKSKNHKYLWLTSIFLSLTYLTRNDTLVLAIPIWAYLAWGSIRSFKKITFKDFKYLIGGLSIYALCIVGQFLFQYLYYGEFLPNTYVLKLTGMPFWLRIKDGAHFILPFFKEIGLILFLSSVELFFNYKKNNLLLFVIVLFSMGYQVYVGGDGWDYWRMLAPTMPLLILLFISSLNAIAIIISHKETFGGYFLRNPIISKKNLAQIILIVLAIGGLVIINLRFLPEIYFTRLPLTASQNWKNIDAAIAIEKATKDDASVGVTYAGIIPYFTGRYAIDFLGKSDSYIAHLPPDLSGKASNLGMLSVPGHNKYDLNYSIKELKPTYVQRFTWGTQDLSQWAGQNYIGVAYGPIGLSLLKDSQDVYWDLVDGD